VRHGFVPFDLGAFTYLADSASAVQWHLAGKAIVGPAAGRSYAVFGDPTWNHLRVRARFYPAGSTAGIAVGVGNSGPVTQTIFALIENDELVLVRRSDGVDEELGRAPLAQPPGSVALEVTAFDDRVRAQVGDVIVEGDRDSVREGRVALVTDGAASFDALLVDGIDLFQIPFATSRYLSFTEHIADREPAVAVHAPDGMGAAPTRTPAQVLAGDAVAITEAMSESGDPQARQELFSRTLSDIGLPELERCDRVTLTRLSDATGTSAILLESPESISIIHDVTLVVTRRTWHYVPPRMQPPSRGELLEELLTPPPAPQREPVEAGALVTVVRPPVVGLGSDQMTGDGSESGHWVEVDTQVACTSLANGDEKAALIMPEAPLAAGTYVIALTLDRTRWRSSTSDPEATYHDEATIELSW
jgi:hypothetical protein